MTIPYIIEDHITHRQVEVPQEILVYCDDTTIDADRYDLRYLDCVYMQMGYYGNDSKQLKQFREKLYNKAAPVFD